MRHVILSLLASVGLVAPHLHAEEANESSAEISNAERTTDVETDDSRDARLGQWVFLGCVANQGQCQQIAYRGGFRFQNMQQSAQYCGGGGYPGGGYPGGHGRPGGWGGGHGGPGGWGGGHGRPGGWGGGHGRPGGWGGGHRERSVTENVDDNSDSANFETSGAEANARTHGGYGYAGFACFGAR